ncbi:MAG: preprotein translocase subunit SecG [Candidatus Omnitrophica bacterium]|nr:preprotein translocase subunit SecG [Candidatus Omnitrophota bacterium]
MTGFVMFLHAVVALFLIMIILMQSGRGGGLTEGFASAESIFGAKTNEFLIKATTIFATAFLITCLGLAVLSAQKSRSLMSNEAAPMVQVPLTQAVETAAEKADEQVKAIEGEAALQPPTEAPAEVVPAAEAIPDKAPVVSTP